MSTRTWFLPRPRTVKTRPRVKPRLRGKRGRGRTSRQKGRPDGNFHPKSSFMTSLLKPDRVLLEVFDSTIIQQNIFLLWAFDHVMDSNSRSKTIECLILSPFQPQTSRIFDGIPDGKHTEGTRFF
jgi:hypothetical protein